MRPTTIAIWLLAAAAANAAAITIDLDTSGLPAGDYLFDFQFINGDNVTGNNTATVSDFMSTNLTLGALLTFGTVTGTDLTSGLTLTDGPITEVDQAFTATSAAASVSFTVNYSANYAPPGPGDAFTFAITDTSLNSTRSAGNGAEFEIDITGANPTVSFYPADSAFGGFEPAPGTAGGVATPEVSTASLSGAGLFLLALLALHQKNSHSIFR
ncbi:MAG: hypothetical protein ABSH09_30435, partial [Bryobacteraceae bacterium]